MANRITQIRYYEDNSVKNYPSVENLYNELLTGSLFDEYAPIYQLGIQGLPGTEFYLNNALTPIIIGSTGIYELDLLNYGIEISHLNFTASSLNSIKNNPNAYLIVDLVCGGGE